MAYAFAHWDRIASMANPAGYVSRVGRNAARSRRKPLPHVAIDEAERYGYEPGLPAALNRLTEQQRQAVLLVHASGVSLVEAAALLDVSVSTLRNHLQRGLAALRKHLGVSLDD